MERKLARGDKLVVASHNAGKVREIAELLMPYGVDAVSAGELGLAEPAETGTTFAENAEIKARAAAAASGLAALADDSGLEVDALEGAPGIYSARWAAPEMEFGCAMARVERELEAKGARASATRRANFTCALTIAWPDGHMATFEGRVRGEIVWPPRGTRGFGYDPIFMADGQEVTFGEMVPAEKHAISHRANAFGKFVAACLSETDPP